MVALTLTLAGFVLAGLRLIGLLLTLPFSDEHERPQRWGQLLVTALFALVLLIAYVYLRTH
jgi:hypothetical protein